MIPVDKLDVEEKESVSIDSSTSGNGINFEDPQIMSEGHCLNFLEQSDLMEMKEPEEDEKKEILEVCLNENLLNKDVDPSVESNENAASSIESDKEVSSSPESTDQKLQDLIDKMEVSLAQGGTPNFKLFWELRKTCLELFKENISPAARAQFWSRYRELSKEAKKLKDLFDEQSAFAVEQIEIAIKVLESEIEEMPLHLDKMQEVNFEVVPKSFLKKKEFYADLQKKLNLLNAHAARVNTLRKELIKTDMRIKHKNNFFERLSKAGDRIFPERKELIREVSQHFEKDIELFVENYFGDQKEVVPTYFLRDDIKHLQNIAKILTLNSQAFSASRKKLSECWDALKIMDKERKKEIQIKRDISKKSYEEALSKIEEIVLSFNVNQITPNDCLDMIDPFFKDLRSLDLGKEESKLLKDKLTLLKKNAQDKIKEKQDERTRLEREKRYKKQEALSELQNQIQEAIQNSSSKTADELKAYAEKVREEAAEFLNQGKDSQDLGKKLKALADIIIDKEDDEILQSSDSGADSLKALRDLLQQKRKRRAEIKTEIEKLRKTAGTSGFDIEKALKQNEQINIEKERLEKADLSISEIEEKIAETKAKLRNL